MKYLFGLGFRPTRDYFTHVETSPFQLDSCFEQGGIHTVVSVPNLLWHEAPGWVFFVSTAIYKPLTTRNRHRGLTL